MKKKQTGIPLDSIISDEKFPSSEPLKDGESGVLFSLHENRLERLRWELSLPTMDGKLRLAIQKEIDCLTFKGIAARKQSREAARCSRKGSLGRQRMIMAMAVSKREKSRLKEFLQAVKTRSIDGIELIGENHFRWDDDDVEYKASLPTLEKCWTEAGKKR